MPNLYIIAGCNGAGKTTASFTVLPDMLDCKEFVNPDEIARGISPFQPEKAAIASGKIMLLRIKELMKMKYGTKLKCRPMKNEKILELRAKILKGIELSFERLVVSKQKNDEEFVFFKDDKIMFVKANEMNS